MCRYPTTFFICLPFQKRLRLHFYQRIVLFPVPLLHIRTDTGMKKKLNQYLPRTF